MKFASDVHTDGNGGWEAVPMGPEGLTLEQRAEQLFRILLEIQDSADALTDEQFCGVVHEAVRSCGFEDALDAWVSLLEVTERRIALIDVRELMPQLPDPRN